MVITQNLLQHVSKCFSLFIDFSQNVISLLDAHVDPFIAHKIVVFYEVSRNFISKLFKGY